MAGYQKGFLERCRTILGFDECFLKTTYKAQLLTTISIIGNNVIFSFAYAVVENECEETWDWFLRQVRDDLWMKNIFNWAIISYKKKGLA